MKKFLVATRSNEKIYQAPGYVLLHLMHNMLPLWMKAMEAFKFVSLPPVAITGDRNSGRPHGVNPQHTHETWYPFVLAAP